MGAHTKVAAGPGVLGLRLRARATAPVHLTRPSRVSQREESPASFHSPLMVRSSPSAPPTTLTRPGAQQRWKDLGFNFF